MTRVLAALAAAFVLAAASPQPGTVKVHESPEPGRRNDPQTGCVLHLHDFTDTSADTWVIRSWPPTGDGSVVASGSGGSEVTLPAGHYKVTWGRNKQKVVWVEGCAPVAPSEPPRVAPSPAGAVAGIVAAPAPTLPPTNTVVAAEPLTAGWWAFALVVLAGLFGLLAARGR